MHIHRRSSLGLELPLGGGVLLAHFQNTQTAQLPGGGLVSGIQSSIATLPADFEQTTVLVADTGINRVCETWGRALLAFGGKTPVANDARSCSASSGTGPTTAPRTTTRTRRADSPWP